MEAFDFLTRQTYWFCEVNVDCVGIFIGSIVGVCL